MLFKQDNKGSLNSLKLMIACYETPPMYRCNVSCIKTKNSESNK